MRVKLWLRARGNTGWVSRPRRPPLGREPRSRRRFSSSSGVHQIGAGPGRRIAELREDAGLTQQRLAERLGVSPQYLRRVESGGVSLSIKSLVRFADALEVAVVDLFEPPRRPGKRNPGRPPKKPRPE